MTTPTQAQIEVAAKAMFVAKSTNDDPEKIWQELLAMPQHALVISHYRNQAEVALTSTAQIGQEQRDTFTAKAWLDAEKELETIEAATIERCAQVALQWENEGYPGDFKTLIERIRKLNGTSDETD